MGDFLVFSDLVSSSSSLSSSLAAAGAVAADYSVTEFAVDCWVIRRGPLGGVEDQLPSSFLGCHRPCQSRLEHRAKRGGKNGALKGHFPSLFQIYFRIPSCAADLSLGSTRWAGLSSNLFGALGLVDGFWAIFSFMFGLPWITGLVGLWTPGGSLRMLDLLRWVLPFNPVQARGWRLPPLVPAASTEAMVDAPMAPPPIPGESVPAAPSSVSGEAEDLREGSVDFSYPVEDWDWTVSGLEPTVDQAWVPNLDEISELLIQKGDLQATPHQFRFPLCCLQGLVSLGGPSCNMFRDTESLRELLLRRWCPSTHTFFFSWGELTPTLEDVANHWMLPILGEHSLSNIKLSAAEEEIAAVLKKGTVIHQTEWLAFILHQPQGCSSPPCCLHIILAIYIFAARDRSAAWGRFSDLPQKFLDHFPSFRDNLPLVYRWGVSFHPLTVHSGYKGQFGLDQGIPIGPQETTSCVADLTAFLKSRAFARWGGETTRVLIPGGHRLRLQHSVHGSLLATCQRRLDCLYHSSARWLEEFCSMSWRIGLIMLSKRGKGSKRDAPADPAFEKTPKKPAPTVSSSKKAPSKKAKAVKQGKSPLLVLSAAEESTTALCKDQPSLPLLLPKRKTRAGKESKSTPSVPSTAEESTTAPLEEPIESTGGPSKKTKAGRKPKSASPPKQTVKKSAASRPPRGQKKASVFLHLRMRKNRLRCQLPRLLRRRSLLLPLFPLGAAGRTRSKSGPKVARGSGGSGGDMVVVELRMMLLQVPRRRMLQGLLPWIKAEDLGKSAADSPGIGVESTGEDHSSSSGSFFDSVPDSVPEEQIVSAESTADDDMPEDDDSSMGLADLNGGRLSHYSFNLARITGPDVSIAHIMEGISLFGVAPSLRAVPAGGFVISASHLTSETPPVVGGALMLEEPRAQGLVESEPVVDLAVGATDHDVPAGDTGASAADTLRRLGCRLDGKIFVPMDLVVILWKILFHGLGCRPMEKGVDDAVHVSEEIDEVGITGESLMRRAPNPHPEQFFWSFNGPLVPFGDFWVPNDCSPYLSRLSAGHSDFTKGFKLSIGLGGPMMSLLGSVLAAMDESSLEDVTKTQILAWRSVIQDLMDVGFDLGFMMERLRQMAQCLFGKRLADEIKALQHQIALLQDSLAELTAYQDAMMSTGGDGSQV
uniref:Aminotransferase-like plant mobile domain-containing protein n=1 Tax=Fagus sylvatica TaxID=28930 RepID=A0A2N9EKD6_FAGSY